ncbi:MAG: STAS domain-containing protein [Clostridia bacterium]|nr:STAS domain-containing protein [Clostridia bacterium]
MEIIKTNENDTLNIKLVGRLDTLTSPSLEEELKSIADVKTLVFDFEELDYISSAGLRTLLATQKIMSKQGNMIIKNVNSDVMEVFEMTGFADILTIE